MVFAKLAVEISFSFTARTLSVCNGSRRELWTGQCGRQANANPNSNPDRWRRAAYRLALEPLDRVPLSRPSDGLDEQLHRHELLALLYCLRSRVGVAAGSQFQRTRR